MGARSNKTLKTKRNKVDAAPANILSAEELAWKMYHFFLLSNATLGVSVDHFQRKSIGMNLATPKPGMFSAVERHAYKLLQRQWAEFKMSKDGKLAIMQLRLNWMRFRSKASCWGKIRSVVRSSADEPLLKAEQIEVKYQNDGSLSGPLPSTTKNAGSPAGKAETSSAGRRSTFLPSFRRAKGKL